MTEMERTLVQLGARLMRLRRARGLSVEELAARAGVAKGNLSEIERGLRDPRYTTLVALAGALGVPLVQMLASPADAPT